MLTAAAADCKRVAGIHKQEGLATDLFWDLRKGTADRY